jgi:hypothetical protein
MMVYLLLKYPEITLCVLLSIQYIPELDYVLAI